MRAFAVIDLAFVFTSCCKAYATIASSNFYPYPNRYFNADGTADAIWRSSRLA
ncbi:hypothetical protein [Ktedonobacter sp. SOSP1-52]|uniref:hypothetical protein n=1 Tax=Ktedonobacter sp. SOSP1-52 TaxID=2778366 RepID=UPI0019155F51|nr:hypothetical protein [Ktedonobacter sp. SOSP1-52]